MKKIFFILSVFFLFSGMIYAEDDSNKAWHEDLMISDNLEKNSVNPILLSDSKGNLHAIWEDNKDGIFSILYRKFNGKNWGNIIRLSDSSKYSRVPLATIDKSDNIHLIYMQNKVNDKGDIYYNIFYTKMNNLTHGPFLLLEENFFPGTWKAYKDMVVDDSGIIHTIGERYLKFNDAGELLEQNTEIKGQSISKDKAGNVYIVKLQNKRKGSLWESIISIKKWDGSNWESLELKETEDRYMGFPWLNDINIGSDNEGDIYLVYTSQLPKRGLYLRKYDGNSWSERETIFSVEPYTYQINSPKLMVDSKKNIHVVFQMTDFKNNFGYNPDCSANEELFRIMYDSSQEKWMERERISEGDRVSWHQSLAIDLNDNLHVIWEDTRNNRGSEPPCDKNWIGYFEIYYDSFSADSILSCQPGDTKKYQCPDETEVSWCDCNTQGLWVCVNSPENACPIVNPPTTITSSQGQVTSGDSTINCGDSLCQNWELTKTHPGYCPQDCKGDTTASPEPEVCDGCLIDAGCVPVGNRLNNEYCDISNEFVQQKFDKAACNNNFECETNLCTKNKCSSPNLIQKVVKWLKSIF